MKRQLNNCYIMAIPIISILFILTIALYLFKGSFLALNLFFVIGIIEMILGKARISLLFRNKKLDYISLLFLLLPSGVALYFNNNTQGFLGSIIILILIFLLRCYLSLKNVKRSAFDNIGKRKTVNNLHSLIFIIGFIIMTSLNIYFTQYYNNSDKINWKIDINGALTSNIKLENENLEFLVNNDYLRRLDYNFPQTYTLNKENGEIIDGKGGYKFAEEFKPYKGKVENLTYKNIDVEVVKNKILIKGIKTNKILMSFIANGNIMITPKIIENNLYLISDNYSAFDKRRQIKVYSIDISKILK